MAISTERQNRLKLTVMQCGHCKRELPVPDGMIDRRYGRPGKSPARRVYDRHCLRMHPGLVLRRAVRRLVGA